MEYRLFLTNALLKAAGEVWGPAALVLAVLEGMTGPPGGAGADRAALQRPVWPDDDLAAVRARRGPWNDHRETDDPEWYAAYLDGLGTVATLTEPSYRAWRARLLPEDLDDQRTARFIAFLQARIANRDERIRQHGTHLPITGQQANEP